MKEFWETALLGQLKPLGQTALDLLLWNVLPMVIILVVGLLLAWSMGHLVERLLRVIGVDHLSNRLGVSAALARGGVKSDPSHLLGRTTYWVIFIFAAIAALGALNLQPVNQFAKTFLAYIPHLFTALLILVIGYLLSNFISQAVLITAVNAGLPPARIVAAFTRWAVQLVAVAMALEQMGIAENIVVVGFGISFGGLVLALALAFGLGAKDLAKEFMERQFGRTKEREKEDLSHL